MKRLVLLLFLFVSIIISGSTFSQRQGKSISNITTEDIRLSLEVHNMAKPAFSAPAKAYLCVAGRQLSTIYTLAIGELISSKNNDHKTKAMLAASAYPINILGTIFQNKFCPEKLFPNKKVFEFDKDSCI